MDKEVRLIDINVLKRYLCDSCSNRASCENIEEVCSDILYIDELPTVEAITREQYHNMTERFFDEFVDNGANEETVAKCMFIGLAFGKLELMLFGENEGGDSDD